MEAEYWWEGKNLNALERGEWFIRHPELEDEIGPLLFDKAEWKGGNLRVRGSKSGAIEVFQTPRNCGHLTIGALPLGYAAIYTKKDKLAVAKADFIARNIAACSGYNVMSASGLPVSIQAFVELDKGWKEVLTVKATRSPNTMSYMICEIPREQMVKMGPYGSTFVSIHKKAA